MTGAGGSIGSEFVRQLSASGMDVCAVDSSEPSLWALNHEPSLLGDIRQPDFIAKYRPHVVVHAAAYKHVPYAESNVAAVIDNNVTGTQRLLDECVRNYVQRFLFISTDKAVEPCSVMGLTKALGERMVLAAGGPMLGTVVRFGNVRDSAGCVTQVWTRQLVRGEPLTLTHPDCTRYFIDKTEAVRLALATLMLRAGVYALDMGEPASLLAMAESLTASSNITITGLRPGEKLTETLVAQHEHLVPAIDGIQEIKVRNG